MSLSRRTFLGTSAATAAGFAAATPPSRAVAEDKAAEEKVDVSKLGKTPHTKFAVNLEMWWRGVPKFEDRIRKAAEFGFPAFEMWPYQGKDIDGIAKLTKELGVAISQFTAWPFEPGMNNPANEDKVVAQIEEACQVAHKLNVHKMCVVAGNLQKGMSMEQMHAQVIKTLKRAAPIVEREKVMLILEPMNGRVDHPGHCLYGSVDAVKICRAVDSPMVKINWDLYHMQISEGDLCGRLKDGFDQVGYLQLADHPGRHEPGTGEIHYNRVLRQAQELGYKDYVGLELTPKTTELAAAIGVAKADVW
ncbi:MAG: hydroxypyruvate isomerase family protein [Pirellulaceae bacterium]